MKTIINKQTGETQINFTAELLSVSDKVFTNVNGTEFRAGNISFKDVHGKTQKSSCMIYEKNYAKGMEIGGLYLATASNTDKGVIVTVSNLSASAPKAEANMFGFATVAESVAEPVVTDAQA